jgi:hypothetical protein
MFQSPILFMTDRSTSIAFYASQRFHPINLRTQTCAPIATTASYLLDSLTSAEADDPLATAGLSYALEATLLEFSQEATKREQS